MAEELQHELQAIENTNRVLDHGRPAAADSRRTGSGAAGRPRRRRPCRSPRALNVGNVNLRSGEFEQQNQQFVVEAGTFVATSATWENLVVNVLGDRPVYLKDVADDHRRSGRGRQLQLDRLRAGRRACMVPTTRASIPPCTSPWPNARAPMPSAVAEAVHRAIGRTGRDALSRRRLLPHHARLRRDGQREGQRAGRRAGRGRADRDRPDRPGDRLAGGTGHRPGDSGLLQR